MIEVAKFFHESCSLFQTTGRIHNSEGQIRTICRRRKRRTADAEEAAAKVISYSNDRTVGLVTRRKRRTADAEEAIAKVINHSNGRKKAGLVTVQEAQDESLRQHGQRKRRC